MNRALIYGYFDLHNGNIVYIGIDTTEKFVRRDNHLEKGRKHLQKINTWLQDRQENVDWIYVELMRIENGKIDIHDFLWQALINSKEDFKSMVHTIEMFLNNVYKPSLNVYGNKENTRSK